MQKCVSKVLLCVEVPEFKEVYTGQPHLHELIDIATKMEGTVRNAGTHAAGVVIGDRPLTQLTPLYKDPRSDLPATQFEFTTRNDTLTTRLVYAFRGKQQYFLRCQWNAEGKDAIPGACDEVAKTLKPAG